ncbi:MAG: hypothetical protein GXP31_03815 [Kiritimatiellaeota bacterium]|nr:hypothetical protein [Kiritimatiellota bacterium]
MTERKLAHVVLRLTGVWLLVTWLGSVAMFLAPLHMAQSALAAAGSGPLLNRLMIWFGLIGPYLAAGACIAIVIWSPKVAAWLFPEDRELRVESWADTPETLLALGFCCIGVGLALKALPTLASSVYEQVTLASSVSLDVRTRTHLQARIVGPSAQFLVGIALFLGARGLSSLWFRLRSATGVRTEAPPD